MKATWPKRTRTKGNYSASAVTRARLRSALKVLSELPRQAFNLGGKITRLLDRKGYKKTPGLVGTSPKWVTRPLSQEGGSDRRLRWPDAGAFIILIFSFGSAVSLVECGVNFCSMRIIGRGNWTRNENEELYAKAWWITTLNGVIKISYTNLCIYAACMLLVQEYRDDEVLENAPCCW